MIARRLVIAGEVQGVGFRQAMVVVAKAARVNGWVCNRMDGSVEALVQGEPTEIDTVIAWCRKGPPAARVSAVDVAEAEPDPAVRGFRWRSTH